jgi:hypothetical protein
MFVLCGAGVGGGCATVRSPNQVDGRRCLRTSPNGSTASLNMFERGAHGIRDQEKFDILFVDSMPKPDVRADAGETAPRIADAEAEAIRQECAASVRFRPGISLRRSRDSGCAEVHRDGMEPAFSTADIFQRGFDMSIATITAPMSASGTQSSVSWTGTLQWTRVPS